MGIAQSVYREWELDDGCKRDVEVRVAQLIASVAWNWGWYTEERSKRSESANERIRNDGRKLTFWSTHSAVRLRDWPGMGGFTADKGWSRVRCSCHITITYFINSVHLHNGPTAFPPFCELVRPKVKCRTMYTRFQN